MRLPPALLMLTVGSIIGFSLVYAGSSGVLWYVPDPTSFPPYKGLVPIVVSWFFSPIFCAIAAASIFLSLKYTILRRHEWGYKASIFLLPLLVFVVFLCCIYFVFTKVYINIYIPTTFSYIMEVSIPVLPPVCPDMKACSRPLLILCILSHQPPTFPHLCHALLTPPPPPALALSVHRRAPKSPSHQRTPAGLTTSHSGSPPAAQPDAPSSLLAAAPSSRGWPTRSTLRPRTLRWKSPIRLDLDLNHLLHLYIGRVLYL